MTTVLTRLAGPVIDGPDAAGVQRAFALGWHVAQLYYDTTPDGPTREHG